MIKQKSIIKILCVLFSMVLIASCGRVSDKNQGAPSAPSGQTEPKSIVTPNGEFPIVTEPITLTFFCQQVPNIPDMATNDFTVMYQEKTGVMIEWDLAPLNALQEKKNISLASNLLPDVYIGSGINREDMMQYGPKGIFIPLNDLIDKYNPELKKAMAQLPIAEKIMTAPDGNIYSYPYLQEILQATCGNRSWINTTWLKELGLDVPKTTDEYINVLRAFKTDVNKNGKQDEIPMILPSVRGSTGITFLMNSFLYFDGGNGIILDDDKIVSVSYNKPEWRDGLRFLNSLYNEGLLDKASFTVTGEQVRQLVESEEAMILGVVTVSNPSDFANLSGERHKNYDPLSPLKGPAGHQTSTWNPYTSTELGALIITSACKYPEVAARWADWFYTWEGTLISREGPEDVGWQRPAPGTLSYTGLPATWERITAYGEASNFKWDGIYFFPQNQLIHPQQGSNTDIYATNGQPARLYQAAKNNMLPYVPNQVFPPLFMDLDVINDFAQIRTDLMRFVDDHIVQFITGVLSLENDWDAYINTFKQLRLDEYITILQDTFDKSGF